MKLKYFLRKMKYNPKRSFMFMFLFLSLVSLTVGYAFLSTTMSIDGVSKMMEARWDIHFDNLVVPDNVPETTPATISTPTSITFGAQLENPGDCYEFTVDVVNAGTIDAHVEQIHILPELTAEQEEYFQYYVTYLDEVNIQEGDTLNAGDQETLLVRFQYRIRNDESVYPLEDVNFSCSISIDYVQGRGEEIEHRNFSNMSWDDIVNYYDILQVGETKEIDMGDFGTHTLRIVNTSTTNCELESKTACEVVFEFADIITIQQLSDNPLNIGGWPNTLNSSYLDSTIYNALPSDLQSVIANTTVVSGHGSNTGAENYTTTNKLFLLSLKELGLSYEYDTAASSTATLDYYQTHNTNADRIKQYNGTDTAYWTRVAEGNNMWWYREVSNTGDSIGLSGTENNVGIAPAFRLYLEKD